MIVLDRNLFEIPPTEIGSTRVLLTLLGGAVVFDATTSPADEEAVEAAYDVELDFDDAGSGSPHGQFYHD